MTLSESVSAHRAAGAAGSDEAAGSEAPAGLRLPVPDEPEALGRQVRDAVLDGGGLHEAVRGEGGIGPWLWDAWRAELEPAGIGSEAFFDVVEGYKREIWFWLLGDRRWASMIAGLSGRLARRVPDSAS
jgi:hypothetical protein